MVNAASRLVAHGAGWGDHMGSGGWWLMAVGALMMAAFGLTLVWLARAASSGGLNSADPCASARVILAERYARGELSVEEYRDRLSQLN